MSDAALRALAERAGLQPDWRDYRDRPQTVSPEALRGVLTAMGLPAGSDAEIAESERSLEERKQAGAFVSAVVGETIALDGGRARLKLESGEARDVDAGGFAVDKIGYHRLERGDGEIVVAVAPPRAPGVRDFVGRDKAWGAAVQLYSLRGSAPSGFGDFAALAEWARASGAAGADALAISPAHALFTASPDRFSPYAPSSRDFLNPLYADPALAGIDGGEEAGGELVDWVPASRARLARLRAGFDRFHGDPDFYRFVGEGGDPLRGHALFEAIDNAQGGGGFLGWPEALREPDAPAVAAFAREHEAEVRFHLWLQWLAGRSLGAAQAAARETMGIGLIADMAVGLDPGGSHAWSRRGELIAGLSIGAPPDEYQERGQGWGITGFSPLALAGQAFEPYLRTVRAALAHAGGVRIDHALGLKRLWVIPEGASPADGCYLTYPFDDLLRLLALEAHRAGALVIGEDLGTVPAGLRDDMAARRLYGMGVLMFEREDGGGFASPRAWRPVAAAMTTTHDMTPIAGWWQGVDRGWREQIGLEFDTPEKRAGDRDKLWDRARAEGVADGDPPPEDDPARAVDAAIGLVAVSACELAIVPAEDLLGFAQAPNLPGTTDEHPNWRRRLAHDADTLFSEPAVCARADRLNETRR
jgi:4-alpha-glucanotransferase